MEKFRLKRLWLLAPGVLALVLTWIAQANPGLTDEGFSQGVYPGLSSAWGFLPSLVPWSVAQWVVVVFLLFVAGFVVYYLVGLIKGSALGMRREARSNAERTMANENSTRDGGSKAAACDGGGQVGTRSDAAATAGPVRRRLLILWHALATALAVVSVGYCIFALMCGLNYYRYTFAQDAGFELRESSVDELAALCENLAAQTNEQRAQVAAAMNDETVSPADSTDSNSTSNGSVNSENVPASFGETAEAADAYAVAHGGFEGYARGAVTNMEALADQYPALSRPLYSPPKPVLFSEVLSYLDIAGMYFPFTVESNINVDGPFFTIPATMGHELAHQCGFMREDEANFIGYLNCKQSDDPLTRYSGYSLAYDYAISALVRADRDRAVAINDTLSEAVRADRRARSEFLKKYEGPVAEASNAANNAYLKANQQQDGTRSYGRMVDLLLAEAREETPGSSAETDA